MTETETRHFEFLLELLKRTRGFDFTGYKRTTLLRRIEKRMATVNIQGFENYSDYLEVNRDEFAELFNTILINVTSFNRDPEAWDALNRVVVSQLVERDGPIRVWSAGCASGEETYTVVMLLAEALGIDQFKKRVKVYATDADLDALTQARHAAYSAADIEELPEDWRTRYFVAGPSGFVFRDDLRRCIIFGEHDLVQDAPISRLDLLICRNTLIYFNTETQRRILARFHFALDDDGYLFLGRSEMLLTHSRLFTPLDARARIFTKVARVHLRDRLLVLAQAGNEDASAMLGQQINLRESSFDAGPVAQVVIDKTGLVTLANDLARDLFRIGQRDIGRPIQDLEMSYRPIELRSQIDEAYAQNRPVAINDVEFATAGGEMRYFDVKITPLVDHPNETVGCSLTFVDVSNHRLLRREVENSAHELARAYEDLQATNEEMETTNEELQSTIEELETTNEELESTNEELETMNEELQSTNEELETVNEELRRRTNELNSANDFLETIMTSMLAGVAVTDSDLNVTLWNHKAEDLWGLRAAEVEGKSFLALDFGLPVDSLTRMMRACLDGTEPGEQFVNAINRRGRPINCRVSCARLSSPEGQLDGLILLMEERNDSKP